MVQVEKEVLLEGESIRKASDGSSQLLKVAALDPFLGINVGSTR
jgi:hypothetical protein